MNVFRLFTLQALQAGILSGGVSVDTLVNASPALHPAVVPNNNLTLANSYTAPQVFSNVSGIAPTIGANAQTGKANRNVGNAWASLVATGGPASPQVGLMTTARSSDYFTLIPPPSTTLVQINLTGTLQSGMGFKAGDKPDGVKTIAAAQVRNGAHVAVSIDQQAPVVYDLFNQALGVSVFLDGAAQHSILVSHTGFFGSQVPVVGPPIAAGSSSLAGHVTAQVSATQGQAAAASTIAAVWTLKALSASTYSLTKTVPGGSPVAVGGTHNTNTLYDSTAEAPGVAFSVSGSSLVANDTATFATDVATVTLQSVAFFTSPGGSAGQYQTPILDSGDPATQWFLYEQAESVFANGSSTTGLSVTVGNQLASAWVSPTAGPAPVTRGPLAYLVNANPDPTSNNGAASYSTIVGGVSTALTPVAKILPSTGERRNAAGLSGAPVGQYAQFTLQLAINTQNQTAWARDFRVYSWVPTVAGSPLLLAKFGLPPNWVPGPNMQAYFGTLLTFVADYYANTNDLLASFGLGTAVDQYLLAKGNDLGLPHIPGEPTSAYQTRLATSLQSKTLATPPTAIATTGVGSLTAPLAVAGAGSVTLSPVAGEQGSIHSICGQMAELLSGVSPTLTSVVASSTGFVTVTGGGVTVAQLATRGISIALPNPPYPGLPGLAYGTTGGLDNPAKVIIKQFAQSLMPAGTLFNKDSATYLNFNTLG